MPTPDMRAAPPTNDLGPGRPWAGSSGSNRFTLPTAGALLAITWRVGGWDVQEAISADYHDLGGCASDVCSRHIVPAGNALRIGPSKSEREPTSGRSKHCGRGHRVPAFRGIGRKFS
jgi:hypothetical protein